MQIDLGKIPEIFYDLIARIMPGSLLILLAYMIANGPYDTLSEILSLEISFWGILILAIASYFLAIILTSIWDFFERLVKKKSPQDITYLKKLSKIEDKFPTIASRLTKYLAERNMCKALIVGLILLSLIIFLMWVMDSLKINKQYGWLLFGFFISILSLFEWQRILQKNRTDTISGIEIQVKKKKS
jgi:hypothetical protein